MIETSAKLVRDNPDLVQRFVNASIEGWYGYLYGDPAPGNALIKQDNPEETDELFAYAIAKMKEYGIVDSGDAKRLGIGAMTDARWRGFFDGHGAARPLSQGHGLPARPIPRVSSIGAWIEICANRWRIWSTTRVGASANPSATAWPRSKASISLWSRASS